MMGWLGSWLFHPALALGGAAVAAPILIHILSRRRFRIVDWAAMDFLLAALRQNRRRVQLEQIILLMLRCLVVLLLALMVARPFLRPAAAAALLGSGARTERIVVLDDSFSMQYGLGAGETVFSRGCKAVEQLARWVGSELPNDSLTLIRSSRPEQAVVALPNLSEENLAKLRDALAQPAASDLARGAASAVASVSEMIERSPTQTNTAVYLVSDFQRVDWIRGAGAGAEPASVITPLAQLAEKRKSVRLTLVDVGADGPVNLAVTEISSSAPRAVAGVRGRYDVTVANYSGDTVSDGELRGSNADQALPTIVLPRLEEGRTLSEPLEVTFGQEGADRVAAEVISAAAEDRLAIDNRRAVGVEVAAGVPLLLVDGEPSSDGYRDEVYLLKTALSPAGRVASGNEVRVIPDDQLDSTDLSALDAVFLANVYRIDDAAQRKLEQYVRDGGGLVIFAGDQVDASLYNERLYAGGHGLLPAELGETLNAMDAADGVANGSWDEGHPIFRPFSGEAGRLLKSPRFYAYVGVQPAARSTSAPAGEAATTTTQTVTTQPAARVLASLDDAEHSPLLVERSFGAGRVILCTTSADLEWNGWGRDPSYLPTMLQIAQYVARPSSFVGQVTAGSPIQIKLDANRFGLQASLRLPSYPADPAYPLEAKSGDGGFYLLWERTDRVGIYTFELKRTGGESALRYVAVNPDARESDLRRASRAELAEALKEMKFEYVRDVGAFADESATARREIWWPILLATVAILMLEQGLARWFGARA